MDARTNHFLADFSETGRERLVKRLTYQELRKGDYIFRENDPAQGICLVLDGEVEIVKATDHGPGQVLACMRANESLGELAVLEGQSRNTDARAGTGASIAWISRADLLKVLNTEPVSLTLRLFQNALGSFQKTNDVYAEEMVRKEKLALMGELAGTLTHELRNPLTGIRLASERIDTIHSDAETSECCEKIRVQCDRVIDMAGDLLEFSRGETKLRLERTDTSALTASFLALNEGSSKEIDNKLHVQAEPAEIEVDTMRLQRVLQNLVLNAADALHGRPDGRIDVQAWVLDGVLNLVVRDNGPGIPDEVKDLLFEPFITAGESPGPGLGLAIVDNIVTAHRGKISVETQAGQGTEFLIRIPQDGKSRAVV
jgi:signal transduction histidine kinase